MTAASTERSPRVTHVSWGRVEATDLGAFKDAKLWPARLHTDLASRGRRVGAVLHSTC